MYMRTDVCKLLDLYIYFMNMHTRARNTAYYAQSMHLLCSTGQ